MACADCDSGTYRSSGCNGESTRDDKQCSSQPTCMEGAYLASSSLTREGTCTACADCDSGTYRSGGCAGNGKTDDKQCTACADVYTDCDSGKFFLATSCGGASDGCMSCSLSNAACKSGEYYLASNCNGANNGCTKCSLANVACKAGEYFHPSNCRDVSDGCAVCSNTFCQNQGNRTGTCTGTTNGYQCVCTPGFSGSTCEVDDVAVAAAVAAQKEAEAAAADAAAADAAADAAAQKEAEAAYVLGGIAGGVVLVSVTHYFLAPPEQRSLEVYLLVNGGLIDVGSDATYVGYEEFDDDTLRYSSIVVLSLPVVVVFLAFWALVTTDYTGRRWRYLTAFAEGGVWLVTVAASLAFTWSIEAGWPVVSRVFASQGCIATLANFAWLEETEMKSTERLETGGALQEVVRDYKFYEKGITQALLAVIVFPIVIVLGAILSAIALVVIWILAAVAGLLAALALPLAFATMALLRLFVLLPSAWEALFDMSSSVATQVDAALPFVYFDDDACARLRASVFGLTDKGDRSAYDLLQTTVSYLAIEFCLESLPQIIIQVVNNERTGSWSYVAIASMTVSIYAIVATVYKYACKSRKKARRAVANPAPAATAINTGATFVADFC